ncbi:MAG: ribosomal RNA small subunit methyltransferase G [Thermodesulfobacteriota bacterium]|nr:MAG: ribosomal RNA small subunit methyltransferase G [Thermodesulfobacteriota bacterium]
MSLRDFLIDSSREFGVEISDAQLDLFFLYLENLKKWNDRINLTAIRNDREIVLNHFVDSISVTPFIEDRKKLLDIGSGGGFPGIPIKIIRSGLNVTLLDSVNKKVSFMNDTIRKLSLQDINAVWGRAEDLSNQVHRGSFDYVVTRAVGSVVDTITLSSQYVSENGVIVLMRGKKGIQEWNEAKDKIGAGFELLDFKEFALPESDLIRTIFILRPKQLSQDQIS